jgi:1-phosphofructokinase
MIYTVTLNAALDKTVRIREFTIGSLNRVESVHLEAGGKGINVAKAIRSLEHDCVAMGFLGGAAGDIIEDRLSSLGIVCDFVRVTGDTRTNIKIVDPVTQTVTEINESGTEILPGELEVLENRLLQRVLPGDTVIFSGSIPPGIDNDIYARWIRVLREAGVVTMLDADGKAFRSGVAEAPSAVKPNLPELARFCDKRSLAVCDVGQEAEVLLQKGIETIIVSMGTEGALFFCEHGAWQSPALDIDVKSTVGAGDAMVAAWAVARELNMTTQEMLRFAVAAASATVITGEAGSFPKRLVEELLRQVKIDPYPEI